MSKAFATLGIPETATPAEVKAKWRELCGIHHPDRGGNPVDFNTIRKAYKIAMDEALAPKACPQCSGLGKVKQVHGFHSIDLPCVSCAGSGHVLEHRA
jgi:DnaJ-class molecular chaperone